MTVANFEGVELKKVVQINIKGIWYWLEEGSLEAKENCFYYKTDEGIYSVLGTSVDGMRTMVPEN